MSDSQDFDHTNSCCVCTHLAGFVWLAYIFAGTFSRIPLIFCSNFWGEIALFFLPGSIQTSLPLCNPCNPSSESKESHRGVMIFQTRVMSRVCGIERVWSENHKESTE